MKSMRKLQTLILLCATGMTAMSAYAKDHIFTTGRLLDASQDERTKKGNTVSHAMYTVELDGMVYTVRAGTVKAKTKDIAKGMIVGDPVQASVDGQHVYIRTPDGKTIKTDVIKRARAQG